MTYPAFLPGDVLSRAKDPFEHYGIPVTTDAVLEITPGLPPQLVSLIAFASGKPVTIHRSPDDERPAILARAWHVYYNQSEYRYLTNNCQHLKNYVVMGSTYSEGVRAVCLLLLLGISLYVAKRAS